MADYKHLVLTKIKVLTVIWPILTASVQAMFSVLLFTSPCMSFVTLFFFSLQLIMKRLIKPASVDWVIATWGATVFHSREKSRDVISQIWPQGRKKACLIFIEPGVADQAACRWKSIHNDNEQMSSVGLSRLLSFLFSLFFSSSSSSSSSFSTTWDW